MFRFGSDSAPDFLPDPDAREWISTRISELARQLGPPAQQPRLLAAPAGGLPTDLDGFFELVCALQELVGQQAVEFALLQVDPGASELPKDYVALGDPSGQLLHTARGRGEYVLMFAPTVFRKRELLFAGLARELGRMAIHEAGGHGDTPRGEYEADAELAAMTLGMGAWVANGAYVFENACCGGGCGVDLRGLRAGLTMPEACYALALDSRRKGLARRAVTRHLDPTQTAAFKESWRSIERAPPPALNASATAAEYS